MRLANSGSARAGAAVLVLILSWGGSAMGQSGIELPEAVLREPWNQQLAVLQSMSGSIIGANADIRAQLGDALATIAIAVGEYERQGDRVIDRLVGDPQFAYVAAETSQQLSAQLAEVHARFGALYAMLAVKEHGDVRAAQNSLDNLRKILGDHQSFESDVLRALGSGSRQQIGELATRWWHGEERAIAVKTLAAELRQELDTISGAEVPRTR